MIRKLQADNQIRFDLTQQVRELEEKTRQENWDLIAANKEKIAKLTAERTD